MSMRNLLLMAASAAVLSGISSCCAFSATSSAASNQSNQRVFVSTPVSKYPKRLVKDCMTTTPLVVLTPSMSVDEAMALLLSRGLSGAPVVDGQDSRRLVSSFDFLQKEAFEGALLPMEGSPQHVELYVEAAQRICGQQVSDVMTYQPEQTTLDTPMRTAAALMTKQRLHRLPVVDTSTGRLMGILSASDVMRDLLHVVRSLPPVTSAAARHGDEKGGE